MRCCIRVDGPIGDAIQQLLAVKDKESLEHLEFTCSDNKSPVTQGIAFGELFPNLRQLVVYCSNLIVSSLPANLVSLSVNEARVQAFSRPLDTLIWGPRARRMWVEPQLVHRVVLLQEDNWFWDAVQDVRVLVCEAFEPSPSFLANLPQTLEWVRTPSASWNPQQSAALF